MLLLRVEGLPATIQFELGLAAIVGAVVRPASKAEFALEGFVGVDGLNVDLARPALLVAPWATSGPESLTGKRKLIGS
jgi:hypothetical protein